MLIPTPPKHDPYSLCAKGHIPLDKSWIIRMGLLDCIHGHHDSIDYLASCQEELGEDLQALLRVSKNWFAQETVLDVGESGTIYRYFRYMTWARGLKHTFIKRGTLATRPINDDPAVVNWPIEQLLTLDNFTSQWASAAILLERVASPNGDAAYHLRMTQEALDHWKEKRQAGDCWKPRYDQTLLTQATAFSDLCKDGKTDWQAQQPEDYCFGRTFGVLTRAYGQEHWPSLQGHESERFDEMDDQLALYKLGEPVTSHDHRVVQALAMKAKVDRKDVKFTDPACVRKTWPNFWDVINEIDRYEKDGSL